MATLWQLYANSMVTPTWLKFTKKWTNEQKKCSIVNVAFIIYALLHRVTSSYLILFEK